MSERPPLVEDTLAGLGWPLRLTRLGLIAERITRSFWPVWSILLAAIAIDAFDLQAALPRVVAWTGLRLILAGRLWGLLSGISRPRAPSR